MKNLALFLLPLAFLSGHAQQAAPKWPQTVSSPAGTITIYEPQVDSFNQNVLTSHAAVSLTPSGQSAPIFGAMWFSSNVQTDRDARTVQLLNVTVTNSRFPQADQSQVAAITQAIGQNTAGMTLSLDNILTSLSQTQKEAAASTNLNNAPPQIVFSDVPSVLVSLDGPPQLVPVSGSSLMRVANTPFFIALDPAAKTYYLRGPGQWLSAANIMGPWETAQNVPQAVTALAASQNTASTAGDQQAMESGGVPKIIVATQPTELIQTDGPEEFSTISGTSLLYVSNTDSDVFMDINSQALYVLLSGRWYTAASQNGPWTFVSSNQLPPDFAQIPAGSPKASVLASVAGTPPAKDAVLDASVPQTAAIKRDAPGPDIKYDGDPKFESIQGTSVKYAVNTAHAVVEVDDAYYCCSDGVWFVAPGPAGPWTVALSVPGVIYTIPPTCPIYNVTYCYVYNSTPEVVYCGYLPGYLGSFVWGGTVVYGTGWAYAPWVGGVYIPRPATWGFAASFNAGTCSWGFSVGVGVGWGATFGVAHTSGWWGPAGWHNNNNSWNNNNWRSNNNVTVNRNVTNNFNNTTNNIYNRHSNRVVQNSGNRIDNAHNTIANDSGNTVKNKIADNDGNRVRQADGNFGDGNLRSNHHRNDVYAGSDGNIYKHSYDGWQQRSGDSWQSMRDSANRESFEQNVRPQLNRDFQGRSFGGGFRGGGFRR